jgi:hypothetical protein
VFTPIDLINAKHYLVINFLLENKTSCLSMDQTNPFADFTQQEKTICTRPGTFERKSRFSNTTFWYALRTFMSNWNSWGTKHWFDFISWGYVKVTEWVSLKQCKTNGTVDLVSTPVYFLQQKKKEWWLLRQTFKWMPLENYRRRNVRSWFPYWNQQE